MAAVPTTSFNQYAPGGVWKQISDGDASGPGTTYNQYANGGVWEQMRLMLTGTPALDQYFPGSVYAQCAALVA
jgi:hypothetical protein